MAARLIIRPLHPMTDLVDWLVIDDNHTIVDGPRRTELAELAEQTENRHIIVLVSGLTMQIVQTQIPRTSRTNLLKAIPFAIEEQLAAATDKSHFALLAEEDNAQTIAVIDREQMDSWQQQFSMVGISADAWIPDLFALPVAATTWYALIDDNHVLCSCGQQLKFACDRDNFYDLMQLYIETETYPTPSHIDVICQRDQPYQLPNNAVSISGVPVQVEFTDTPILTYLSQHLPTSASINLLQGDYRPSRQRIKAKQTWLIAAGAAALWLTTVFIHDIHHYLAFNRLYKTQQEDIKQIYREVFSTATAVISPKLRFERELARLQHGRGGGSLLFILSTASPIIKQAMQTNPQIAVQNLEFKNNQLNLNLRADRFDTLDKLSQALKKSGLMVEQVDAKRSEKFVISTLLIRKTP